MDITALETYLKTFATGNTVLVLSTEIHNSIKKIQTSLPRVTLTYTPCSLYHCEYLQLLHSFGLHFNCPNQEVLCSLKHVPNRRVTIDNELLTSSFIKSAVVNHCRSFLIDGADDIRRIAESAGDNVQYTLKVPNRDEGIHLLQNNTIAGIHLSGLNFQNDLKTRADIEDVFEMVEIARKNGHQVKSVNLGRISDLDCLKEIGEELRAMDQQLQSGSQELHEELDLRFEVAEELLLSCVLAATRILESAVDPETGVKHYVDVSLFGELSSYLGETDNNGISVVIDDGTSTVPGLVLGNSFDDDDIIVKGDIPRRPPSNWILLRNISKAALSEMDVILLDNNMRNLHVVSGWTCTATSHEIPYSREGVRVVV